VGAGIALFPEICLAVYLLKLMGRVGQNHTYTRLYGVCTVFNMVGLAKTMHTYVYMDTWYSIFN